MGGGSGCETTASTGLSPLLTSLLSHCSHGGNSFTAEPFVNDGPSGHRRRRRPLSRSSLTKVSAVKHAPPCKRCSRAGAAHAFFLRTGPDECCRSFCLLSCTSFLLETRSTKLLTCPAMTESDSD